MGGPGRNTETRTEGIATIRSHLGIGYGEIGRILGRNTETRTEGIATASDFPSLGKKGGDKKDETPRPEPRGLRLLVPIHHLPEQIAIGRNTETRTEGIVTGCDLASSLNMVMAAARRNTETRTEGIATSTSPAAVSGESLNAQRRNTETRTEGIATGDPFTRNSPPAPTVGRNTETRTEGIATHFWHLPSYQTRGTLKGCGNSEGGVPSW
jgi:hypothetical protein